MQARKSQFEIRIEIRIRIRAESNRIESNSKANPNPNPIESNQNQNPNPKRIPIRIPIESNRELLWPFGAFVVARVKPSFGQQVAPANERFGRARSPRVIDCGAQFEAEAKAKAKAEAKAEADLLTRAQRNLSSLFLLAALAAKTGNFLVCMGSRFASCSASCDCAR